MESVKKKAREIAGRLASIKALEVFLSCMLISGGVFFLLVFAEKLFVVSLYPYYTLPSLAVLSGITAFAASISVRRAVQDAAIKADQELKLKERLSTALSATDTESPFAPLLLADAERHAENIKVSEAFPVRLRMHSWLAPFALLAAGFLLSLLNPIDVFGRTKALAEKENEKETVKKIVKITQEKIKKITENKEFDRLDDDVKKIFEGVLKDLNKRIKRPNDIKEAMKEMRDKEEEVSKKASEFAKNSDKAADDIDKKMNEMRDLMREIPKLMKKGEIDKLVQKLNSMQEKIDQDPNLTEEEKKALKDQMRQLASLAKKMKNQGPDVVLPAEFRDLMKNMKNSRYANLPREMSQADKEKLKKLLSNKDFLNKLKEQLKNGQSQLAKGGG